MASEVISEHLILCPQTPLVRVCLRTYARTIIGAPQIVSTFRRQWYANFAYLLLKCTTQKFFSISEAAWLCNSVGYTYQAVNTSTFILCVLSSIETRHSYIPNVGDKHADDAQLGG